MESVVDPELVAGQGDVYLYLQSGQECAGCGGAGAGAVLGVHLRDAVLRYVLVVVVLRSEGEGIEVRALLCWSFGVEEMRDRGTHRSRNSTRRQEEGRRLVVDGGVIAVTGLLVIVVLAWAAFRSGQMVAEVEDLLWERHNHGRTHPCTGLDNHLPAE